MNVRLFAGLLVLIHLQRPDQAPAFKSGVDVVGLDVSVTRNGIPVRGLTAADFVVSDNGVQQVVDSVVVDRLRLSVELVLASGSVLGDRLTNLIAAADGLVAALRPGEWAGLLTFSHRLRPLVPITEDLASVRGALAALSADGRTALRDAVQLALATEYDARARPLILVFSDGVDNASWLSDEQVLESARRAGIVIHVVTVTSRDALLSISRRLSPTWFVERVVETTGGRLWSAESESDLARLFTSALDEMRARYLLSFLPSRPLRPGWHALRVRLKNGGGDITARSGYFVTVIATSSCELSAREGQIAGFGDNGDWGGGIEENATMAEARRVRLYWDDGTVETPHQPIDPTVTMIIRQAKDGTHRHFEVTDDLDGDGYVIALELPRDM